MASNFAALLKLDATQLGRRRLFLLLSIIWTPLARLHGVQSFRSLQSGRLVSQHVASNLRSYRHLDALQHLDAMLHQNSPANIPGIPQNKTGNCLAFHNSGKRAVAFISLMWKVYSPKGINLLRILFGYCLSCHASKNKPMHSLKYPSSQRNPGLFGGFHKVKISGKEEKGNVSETMPPFLSLYFHPYCGKLIAVRF